MHPDVARMLEQEAADRAKAHIAERVAFNGRIEELETAIRAALSFVQGRHPDHSDGHAQMVIAALRGALRNRNKG